MSRMSASLEKALREKVRETANVMRRYADEMDLAADHADVTYIPAAVVQINVNMAMNLRLDLPAVYLGELVRAERAELELAAQERMGSPTEGEK